MNLNTNMNLLTFIAITTVFSIIYLIQQNNYREYWKESTNLDKTLLFYTKQIALKNGNVAGLKRSDRIREIAMQKLNMYIAEPESLIIVIDE
tara:strand:- start:380 stop:655 length:276 start_codon:yes stop_codon:yes gene_type:complete